jgi:hypothetical protein
MPLISNGLKESLAKTLNEIHESVARDIIVYSESFEAAATPDFFDVNASSIYKKPAKNPNGTNVLVSEIIQARILYPKNQDEIALQSLGVAVSKGRVRIKVDRADVAKIQNAKRIAVDNVLYVLTSDYKDEDQINQQFVSFMLNREN